MIPASLYMPLYIHVMLLVVIGFALLYWQAQTRSLAPFNQVAMIVIGFGVALFMGFRPISGVYFVDMGSYATEYERVQQGNAGRSADVLFNVLQQLCAPVLPTEGFFFVCALIYIAPLAVASWRVHGSWAFPVFLAFLTAFSFWAYGVNGIRNGMACSVLILAFAFHDKPVIMFLVMAAACEIHASVLLPAGAFFIVRYFKRTEVWLALWAACVVISFAGGGVGEMLLSRFNPFAGETRADQYLVGAQGGFRPDFIAYSIVPVLATLLLAAPTRARARRLINRAKAGPALTWMGNRSAMALKRIGMGKPLGPHRVSPTGGLALAGFGSTTRDPRGALGATLSTLNSPSSVALAKEDQPSTREQLTALGGQKRSMPRAGKRQSGWNSLPWVQFLHSDPFYERLVNTYLLANTIWVLIIHATCANRFAYLSWFMLPWVLLYPFVPGRSKGRPRTGLMAAVLFAHCLFTYFMMEVVYPLRGGGYM